MDLYDTNPEYVESSEVEDTGAPNASTQNTGAQVVDGQHINTSVLSLHGDASQTVATRNTSTLASGFHSIRDFNPTSFSHLVQNANSSCATASQVAIPQANTVTLTAAQRGPLFASSVANTIPLADLTTGIGVQSANAHHIMPPGPETDTAGFAMNGTSYGDPTANIQSHNSETAPSANQDNFSSVLHQTSHTRDTSSLNVSAAGYTANFSNSGNSNANANAQNLPAVAGLIFPTTPINSRANNQRGTSLAAADHRTNTLTTAYQTYHQTYLTSNQSHAAAHVNPNHGIRANNTPNPNVQPTLGLANATNTSQSTNSEPQADALRSLAAQVNQVRVMSPRAETPLNHTQGPFLDLNDPVSIEISQRTTNIQAINEHRVQANAADVDHRSSLIHQNILSAFPLQAQPTNEAAGYQVANEGPVSSNGTLQIADNAFDAMLQAIGDQDIQLASAGLDNRGNPILPRPAQPYTENDSLQAYLIRQQLVADIPPEEVVPMNGFSNQQQLLYGGPMRAREPTLIRVQRRTGATTIPYIPRARFNGRIDPLPFDTQSLNSAISQTVQISPSDDSLLQLGGGSEANQGTFGSDTALLQHVFPDDTQQTTDNDVIMNNYDGTHTE